MGKTSRKSIISSTLLSAAIIVVSKLLGFVKQAMIASRFGASYETDVFFVSSGLVSNLCVAVFSAISISLLVHYTKACSISKESGNKLITDVIKVFVPLSLLLAVIVCIFAPIISEFAVPSYNEEAKKLLAQQIRMMSICIVTTCYFLVVNVTVEADKRFIPGRSSGLIQNILLIVGVVVFAEFYSTNALIYSFIAAGIIQCIIITYSARNCMHLSMQTKIDWTEIKYLIVISIPLLVGNAAYELNDFVDKKVAASCGEGSVSYLTYGGSIQDVVVAVMLTSLSTVLFAHFASMVANGEKEKAQKVLNKLLMFLPLVMLPICMICIIFNYDIVKMLFGRNAFSESEVIQTGKVMAAYAIGFVFQGFRGNIVKVYYAFENTKTPMINGLISVCINILLSILLSKWIGVAGVALATSIAMLISSVMLIIGIKKYFPDFSFKAIMPENIKCLVSSILSLIACNVIASRLDNSYIRLLIVSVSMMFVYIVLLYLTKSECLKTIIQSVRRRFAK